MVRFRIVLLSALALGIATSLHAQLRNLPRPVGYVNDFANVIPPEQEAAIDRIAREVLQKSGGEIVVVTLPSLEGRNRDEVALQIGREWGIGRKGEPGDPARNTGTVVLVAPEERQLKIETGLGTNTFITAAEAGRVADQYMVPHFRNGDYGTGILQAVNALALHYAEQFNFELTGQVAQTQPQTQQRRPTGRLPLGRIIFFIILIMILSSMFGGGRGGRGRRRGGFPWWILLLPRGGGHRGGWGGFGGGFGGFGGGGGFGGFGGGGFGGGGAGRSW